MSEQQPLILGAFTRQQVVTAAGLAAAAFVGYCIYFDHKRRSAPDYKQKIRESKHLLHFIFLEGDVDRVRVLHQRCMSV